MSCTARCFLPGQTCKRQVPRSNVKFNLNIALTLTLFRWVSGEMLVIHNAASGFFSTTVTINQQKIIIFLQIPNYRPLKTAKLTYSACTIVEPWYTRTLKLQACILYY